MANRAWTGVGISSGDLGLGVGLVVRQSWCGYGSMGGAGNEDVLGWNSDVGLSRHHRAKRGKCPDPTVNASGNARVLCLSNSASQVATGPECH